MSGNRFHIHTPQDYLSQLNPNNLPQVIVHNNNPFPFGVLQQQPQMAITQHTQQGYYTQLDVFGRPIAQFPGVQVSHTAQPVFQPQTVYRAPTQNIVINNGMLFRIG
jgi:hypothetical protein